MGMLEKIFGRREQPAGLKNAQIFRMLEGYTPAWTTWRGSVYESELIRASLDAWGRHAAKLKPNIRGSAQIASTAKINLFMSTSFTLTCPAV